MKTKYDDMVQFAKKTGLSTHYAVTIMNKRIMPRDVAYTEYKMHQKKYFFDTPRVIDFILKNQSYFTITTIRKVKAKIRGEK